MFKTMNNEKASFRLTEWDKEKTGRMGTGYRFWLKLSRRPDTDWQHFFRAACEELAGKHPFKADLAVPFIEGGPCYARVVGDPREFEDVLFPQLKQAVERANELFNEQQEQAELKDSQKAVKRTEDEQVIEDLKKRFKV